jgi:hypothetical protein
MAAAWSPRPRSTRAGAATAGLKDAAPGEARLAPLPAWLAALVRKGDASRAHPPGYWRELVRRKVPEGVRNNTIASLAGHLLWHGVDPAVTLELLLAWNRVRCDPPLPDAEVAQVVENIARLQERERNAPDESLGQGPGTP